MELARNVLGLEDADHEETSPGASCLVITQLACSLWGQEDRVTFVPGTRVAELYGSASSVEPFMCSYGLEAVWEERLSVAGLRVTARGPDGEPRVVELEGHPFFWATLFVPQCRSSEEAPHPVVRGFVEAVVRA